jgi:ribosomal protein S6--L-glutamate ligase
MGLPIAGVDLLQSSRGPLILEVNSSPGLEGIERATQKDIAASIVRFVVQQTLENRNKPKRRKRIKQNA